MARFTVCLAIVQSVLCVLCTHILQTHTHAQADFRYEENDAVQHLFATASVEDFDLTVNMYTNTMTVNASLGNARVTGMLTVCTYMLTSACVDCLHID